MTTKLLFHFSEPDGVLVSDSMGNLEDMVEGDPAYPVPTSTSAWTGRGRLFADGHSLIAADLPGRDTLLQGDITVQAIMSLGAGPETAATIICRGLAAPAAEYISYGLERNAQNIEDVIEIRWFWQNGAGVMKPQPSCSFKTPGIGKFFLFTATRRWERTDKVVIRYYVNDELIAEFETTDGDIGGGTTGHTIIGARFDGGAITNGFNGVLDELVVTDHEMSHEEVRHTWKRLSEYQPAGVAMMKGLILPGLRWADNPGNNSGRRVKVAGQAHGLAIANTENLKTALPDQMPLVIAPRWEGLCGLSALPNDSLDKRRARVVGYLAREEGYSHPAVRTALEVPLDTPGANLEIVEFTNEVTDSFAAIATERWRAEPSADWTIVANALRVSVAAGQDLRWNQVRLGRHIRMPIDPNSGWFDKLIGRAYVAAKIVGYTLPVGCGAGILMWNAVRSTGVWFGIFNDDGTGLTQLGYRTISDGVLGAWTSLSSPWATTPVWLRFDLLEPNGLLDPVGGRRATMSWSVVGPNAGFASSTVNLVGAGFSELVWAGFAAFGTASSVGGGGMTMDFDDFVSFCPNGLRPYNWYVYRNPALAGEPDIIGGRNLVARLKPAHTHSTVIEGKSVLCGNARYGLCGRGPMGGI